jgi:hypothetical protein
MLSSRRRSINPIRFLAHGVKQLSSSLRLRVIRILDLYPTPTTRRIDPVFPLRNDAFAVTFADRLKEFDTTRLDMLRQQDALRSADIEQAPQPILPFEQWQASQVPLC